MRRLIATSANDSCGCTASGVARTCSQCLNDRLSNGVQCTVTPVGLCVSAASAESYTEYFNATFNVRATPGALQHGNEFFTDAAYCALSDSACMRCGVQWTASFTRDALRSTTDFSCVGVDGCICTAYCHLRATRSSTLLQDASVGGESCYAPVPQSTKARTIALMRNITFLLCGVMIVAMAVLYGMARFHQRRSEQRMLARRQALREQRDAAAATRSGFTLSLSGWNSYRERLIEHEQQQLGLKGDAISLSQAAQASTTPMRVVVEEGEGFRPASPSQLARRRSDAE